MRDDSEKFPVCVNALVFVDVLFTDVMIRKWKSVIFVMFSLPELKKKTFLDVNILSCSQSLLKQLSWAETLQFNL